MNTSHGGEALEVGCHNQWPRSSWPDTPHILQAVPQDHPTMSFAEGEHVSMWATEGAKGIAATW